MLCSCALHEFTLILIQDKMEFLRGDLDHLFDDQGIDQSAYDDKVRFEDPITKYSSVQGDKGLKLYHLRFSVL